MLWARDDLPICERVSCAGPVYDRLLRPLLLAALNIDPPDGSARLAAQALRETLARGGNACRPLIAGQGLGSVFIEPAIDLLRGRKVTIEMHPRIAGGYFPDGSVAELDFSAGPVALAPPDAVILAVPPTAAALLVLDLTTPTASRAILTAHFRIDPPAGMTTMMGVLNATSEWIFAFPGRIAVTISNADRLLDVPRETLAATIWREVAAVTGLGGELPPWQCRARAPRHFCRNSGRKFETSGTAYRLEKFFLWGRLD